MDPAITTLIILAGAAILFFTEILPLPATAMLVPVSLSVSGVLSAQEAFRDFGNKWVVIFMAMFMVGEAVLRTGLAHKVRLATVRVAGTSRAKLLGLIMLAVGVLSAFLSNTGTIAVFIPIVLGICTSANLRPGQVLMPMAFAASLGGTMTLIGTPPNGIINSVIEKTMESSPGLEASVHTFGFFEYGKLGIVLFAAGIVYYIALGYRLLPYNTTDSSPSLQKNDYRFRTRKMPLATAILALVVVMMATKAIPLVTAAMLGACLVIVTRCITVEEAFSSVSWTTIFLFAGMLPMSTAMQKTGAAKAVANVFIAHATNPYALLATTFAVTAVITNLMSNTATTALMAPIGIAVAQGFGISPMPILMGIAAAASCCFLTPIATPPQHHCTRARSLSLSALHQSRLALASPYIHFVGCFDSVDLALLRVREKETGIIPTC